MKDPHLGDHLMRSMVNELYANKGGENVRFDLPLARTIYTSEGGYHMPRLKWGMYADRLGIAMGNVGSGERPNNIEVRDTTYNK